MVSGNRSLTERFGEYVEDTMKDPESSRIATHMKSAHLLYWEPHLEAGDGWMFFKLEVLRTHRSASLSHINEAVSIMREPGTLLNS